MKIMLITVAGKSTRFNQGNSDKPLKCIYHQGGPESSILFRLLRQGADCDKKIVVGGYRFEDLVSYVGALPEADQAQIELVYNPHYEGYGSMYSLHLGLLAAQQYQPEEVRFAEGDLVVDSQSMHKLWACPGDAIAVSTQPIRADQSVVLYVGVDDRFHYLYDTGHQQLLFPQPVKALYNSAQIWKFACPQTLFGLNGDLTQAELQGTNLALIQRYVAAEPVDSFTLVAMSSWYNCNTRADYKCALAHHPA